MIAGVAMKVLHTLAGIAILMCPSSHAFMVASPIVRVPLGLHMAFSPVNALKLNRNKVTLSPTRTAGPLKRITRQKMSNVGEAAPEQQKGFWNKVSAACDKR